MSNFVNKMVNGDLESFRQDIFKTLYTKAGEILDTRKTEIASNLYSETEEQPQEESEGSEE